MRTMDKFRHQDAQTKTWNITYLENCWTNQIGIPLNKPTRVSISNFDNDKFLRGHQKIVTTDQGQYFKLLKNDIDFSALSKNKDK